VPQGPATTERAQPIEKFEDTSGKVSHFTRL
jgi:hypothetical protein